MEVVLVGAAGLPVEDRGGQLRRGESHDQGHRVERDDHHRTGHQTGGDQIRDGLDAHHFQRIDLLGDPHGAEFGGGTGADGGRQRLTGHHRGGQADVDHGGQEAGEGLDADVAQRGEALDGDQRTGRERHEADDGDGSADHGHRTGAHAGLGDEPDDLLAVVPHRVRDLLDGLPREVGHLAAAGEHAVGNVGQPVEAARYRREP